MRRFPGKTARRICLHGILALCLLTAPLAAQERALPPLSDDIAAQFPAIGRLGRPGFREIQGCTATLIAPDLILTAAHCASETGHSGRVFVAGWSRGDYIASRTSKLEMRHPDYIRGKGGLPRHDIALIILESPITDVAPIPLSPDPPEATYGTEVALIGYHRKTPHILSGDFTCPAIRFSDGLLHVGCPVINGNSGGPLLRANADGAWEVVGVVSSRIASGAIAVELSDWIRAEVTAHLTR